MNLYRLGDCLKCRGDLYLDDGDWICLQCGTYYYTGLYPDTQSGAPGGDGRHFLRPAQDELQPALGGAGFLDKQATDEQLAEAAD